MHKIRWLAAASAISAVYAGATLGVGVEIDRIHGHPLQITSATATPTADGVVVEGTLKRLRTQGLVGPATVLVRFVDADGLARAATSGTVTPSQLSRRSTALAHFRIALAGAPRPGERIQVGLEHAGS